eukprot:SAG31_NODE_4543_length_3150_cov_1.656506_1_plen_256_part_10
MYNTLYYCETNVRLPNPPWWEGKGAMPHYQSLNGLHLIWWPRTKEWLLTHDPDEDRAIARVSAPTGLVPTTTLFYMREAQAIKAGDTKSLNTSVSHIGEAEDSNAKSTVWRWFDGTHWKHANVTAYEIPLDIVQDFHKNVTEHKRRVKAAAYEQAQEVQAFYISGIPGGQAIFNGLYSRDPHVPDVNNFPHYSSSAGTHLYHCTNMSVGTTLTIDRVAAIVAAGAVGAFGGDGGGGGGGGGAARCCLGMPPPAPPP